MNRNIVIETTFLIMTRQTMRYRSALRFIIDLKRRSIKRYTENLLKNIAMADRNLARTDHSRAWSICAGDKSFMSANAETNSEIDHESLTNDQNLGVVVSTPFQSLTWAI